VHTWVIEPLAAGAAYTLTAPLPQGSGESGGTLYALVDSTGVVGESDEDNNRTAAGAPVCLAAEDAYEDDDSPAGAKPIAAGSPQARTFGWAGDRDYVLLNLTPGRFYVASTSGLAAGADTRLTLLAGNGQTALMSNDDVSGFSLASRLQFVTGGLMYLLIENWSPAAGGCGSGYAVEVDDAGPAPIFFLPLIRR